MSESARRDGAPATWRRYLRFWGPKPAADVDEELRFHYDMRVREYMHRGMSEQEAREAVLERLGSFPEVRAECVSLAERRERGMARARLVDASLQDARFALRGFARQKGWTAVAVLTLALGIGANTAVFSVVNRLLLNPLPYPDADRIALVNLQPTEANQSGINVSISPSGAVARAWRDGARSFESIEAYAQSSVLLTTRSGQAPAAAQVAYVQPSFPTFAGQRVLRGRMFTATEAAEQAPVALLGESAWRAKFGADSALIGGRAVSVNDRLVTIIGILPAGLALPRFDNTPPDLWMPLDASLDNLGPYMIGRLRPGVSHTSAQLELDSLAARAQSGTGDAGRFKALVADAGILVRYDKALLLLMGAVAVVLLIACVNIAHLLLARSASRHREMAIRMALGAGRARLFRQLLTETLVLATAGCVGGLLLGWAALRALVARRPESLSELGAAQLDGTVLLAAIGLSLVTGIGFGVLATVNAARGTHDSLKAGSPGVSHSRRQHRARGLLVVTEMALSAMLLVGASLLVRSVVHLYTSDPGFDPRGLYAVRPVLPEWRYTDAASRRAFHAELLERVRALPGVTDVAVARSVPPGFNFLIGALQLEGEPPPERGITSLLRTNAVSPSYFRTMRLAIVDGRGFSDSAQAAREVLVNRGFARKHWPDASAVGRRLNVIGWGGNGTWYTVAGVVEDAAMGGLTHTRSDPMFYTANPELERTSVLLRVSPGTDALPALRAAVADLDPNLPLPQLRSIEDAMRATAAEPRFTMILLVSFTVLALVLAAVGLYGVMAYAVAQRTREIGIRMALGATRRDISRDVVSGGVSLAIAGAVVGLAAAWAASRVMESMLHGVTRGDPASFLTGGLVLLGTAALACVVPVRRAALVDPSIAMRAD